jgi:hypothetical protein
MYQFDSVALGQFPSQRVFTATISYEQDTEFVGSHDGGQKRELRKETGQ